MHWKRYIVPFFWVLFWVFANCSAKAQDAEAFLESRSLRIVNSYCTKGLQGGRAVLGPDACIWLGDVNGTLRRLDALSNRTVSERKLAGGIKSCIGNFFSGEKCTVVVGTSRGLYLFGEDGAEVSFTAKPPDAMLLLEPLMDGNGLLLLGQDGLLYRLDENCKLNRIGQRTPLPGVPTSAPVVLNRPYRLAVYGVEVIGDFLTQELRFRIVSAPLNSIQYRVEDVRTDGTGRAAPTDPVEWAASGLTTERVISITAYQAQDSDLGLCLTERGKVFKVDHNGLKTDPLIDLKCSPISQLIPMSEGRIALLGIDTLSERPLRCLFSISGKLISRTPLQDLSGNTGEKVEPNGQLEMLKTTAVFNDNGRLNALIGGLSDGGLRLVDVATGLILASLKIPGHIHDVNHLQGRDFFISEYSGPLPDEVTKHYLVRVVSR